MKLRWRGLGSIKAGASAVRAAKVRSFWTMLGIIIGVASVITVVSIGEGIKQQIGGQIHHLGKDLITVRQGVLKTGSGSANADLLSGFNVSGPLTTKDVTTVMNTPGVAASAPLTIATGQISGDNGSYGDGLVIGTTPDLSSLLNQSMAYGSFLDAGDEGSNVAVLGAHASEALFNEDVPLGHSFTFHGQTFIVRGIFNQFNTAPLAQQADFNNAVFIPYDVAESLTNNTAPTYEILARPTKSDQSQALARTIKHQLDRQHGGQSSFSVLTGSQNVASSDDVLNLLTRLIAGVAAISLFVGGVGIMNVMLVAVGERLHEIGIRKAVGATNRQILGQFMVESTVLSLIGGLLGVGVALAVDLGLRLFTSLRPNISWQLVLLASGVSLLVGVVFGSVPALKAARKDPIEALRSE